MKLNRTLSIFAILMALLAGTALTGQESIVDLRELDLESVDFSQARISIAGPGSFLIRSVQLDGQSYSVIFEEAEGNWIVSQLIPEESAPVLPANVVLDFATISITEEGLLIDGIIIDGKSYSTTLVLGGSGLTPPSTLSAAKLVGASLTRVTRDAGLFTADEVNSQSAQIASLTERNTELVSQVGDLSDQLFNLRDENQRLNDQMLRLREEKAQLDTEVASLEEQVRMLEAAASEIRAAEADEDSAAIEAAAVAEAGAESGAAAQERVSEVEDGANELLRQRITVLLERIAILEDRIVDLETELDGVRLANAEEEAASVFPTAADGSDSAGEPAGDESAIDESAADEYLQRISRLEAIIEDLRVENARLSADRSSIEQEVRRRLLSEGFIAAMLPDLNRRLYSGFEGSQAQLGSWSMNDGVMAQNDANQFFAKLALPLPQETRPTLYRFDGRSPGAGWVGFGIHIFASRSERRGYGFGESLLLWFTRDAGEYGNYRTYLEIYRSSDDINMARVMSAAVAEDIGEWMDIELLYEPQEEYITVAIGGEEKVRYKTWFGIESGVDIALRTLDRGEFRNLEILTTDGD